MASLPPAGKTSGIAEDQGTQTSSVLRLPLEVKDRIVGHLEEGDAYNLATVHSTWQELAERRLYNDIQLHDRFGPGINDRVGVRVIEAIRAQPARSKYVHTLDSPYDCNTLWSELDMMLDLCGPAIRILRLSLGHQIESGCVCADGGCQIDVGWDPSKLVRDGRTRDIRSFTAQLYRHLAASTIMTVLNHSPKLQLLSIRLVIGYERSAADTQITWPKVNLQHFAILDLTADTVWILITLLEQTPTISHLRTDLDLSSPILWTREAFKYVGQREALTHFDCRDEGTPDDYAPSSHHIMDLVEDGEDQAFAALETMACHLGWAADDGSSAIVPLPKLEVIDITYLGGTFPLGTRLYEAEPADDPTPDLMANFVRYQDGSTFPWLARVMATQALRRIRWRPTPGPGACAQLDIFTMQREHTDETLWYLVLSIDQMPKGDGRYLHLMPSWADGHHDSVELHLPLYKGRRVPRSLMVRLWKVSAIEEKEFEAAGNRRMVLSPEAWDMLDCWERQEVDLLKSQRLVMWSE